MRRLLFFVLILSPLLLSACWDYQEPDQLATVYSMGIDRVSGKDPILLTVQILAPEGSSSKKDQGNGEQKSFYTISSRGKSLTEAISNLSTQSPRRVYLAHNKIILLGQDLVANGIGDILDELDRNRELRRTNWMLVADGQAKELLGKEMGPEKAPGRGMEQILQYYKKLNITMPMDRNDLFAQLQGQTGFAFLPVLKWGAESQSSPDAKDKGFTIAETAIVTDKRLIGVLSQNESGDLMWLLDKVKGGTMTLAGCPQREDTGEISLKIISVNTRIRPKVSGDVIKMLVICDGKVAVEGVKPALDLSNPDNVKQLEQQISNVVKVRLEMAIVKAQKEIRADYPGFAATVDDSYPKEWKQIKPRWEEIFPRVQYEVSCNIKIQGFGVIRDPIQETKEKEE